MVGLQAVEQRAAQEGDLINAHQEVTEGNPPLSNTESPAIQPKVANHHAEMSDKELCQSGGATSNNSQEPSKENKSPWSVVEERFFFEYIRIAGDRNKLECCNDIAASLRTKTSHQVAERYNGIVKKLKEKLGKKKSWDNIPQRTLHKRLVEFYDTMVFPARQKGIGTTKMPDKNKEGEKKRSRGEEEEVRDTSLQEREKKQQKTSKETTPTNSNNSCDNNNINAVVKANSISIPKQLHTNTGIPCPAVLAPLNSDPKAIHSEPSMATRKINIQCIPANSQTALLFEGVSHRPLQTIEIDATTTLKSFSRKLVHSLTSPLKGPARKQKGASSSPSSTAYTVTVQGSTDCPIVLRHVTWTSSIIDDGDNNEKFTNTSSKPCDSIKIYDIISILAVPTTAKHACLLYSIEKHVPRSMHASPLIPLSTTTAHVAAAGNHEAAADSKNILAKAVSDYMQCATGSLLLQSTMQKKRKKKKKYKNMVFSERRVAKSIEEITTSPKLAVQCSPLQQALDIRADANNKTTAAGAAAVVTSSDQQRDQADQIKKQKTILQLLTEDDSLMEFERSLLINGIATSHTTDKDSLQSKDVHLPASVPLENASGNRKKIVPELVRLPTNKIGTSSHLVQPHSSILLLQPPTGHLQVRYPLHSNNKTNTLACNMGMYVAWQQQHAALFHGLQLPPPPQVLQPLKATTAAPPPPRSAAANVLENKGTSLFKAVINGGNMPTSPTTKKNKKAKERAVTKRNIPKNNTQEHTIDTDNDGDTYSTPGKGIHSLSARPITNNNNNNNTVDAHACDPVLQLSFENWSCLSPPTNFRLPDDFDAAMTASTPMRTVTAKNDGLGGLGTRGATVNLNNNNNNNNNGAILHGGSPLAHSWLGFNEATNEARAVQGPAANILAHAVDALFEQHVSKNDAALSAGNDAKNAGGSNATAVKNNNNTRRTRQRRPSSGAAAAATIAGRNKAGTSAPSVDFQHMFDGNSTFASLLMMDGKSNSNWLAPLETTATVGAATRKNTSGAAPLVSDKRPFAGLFGSS